MEKSLETVVAANLRQDVYLIERVPAISEIASIVVEALRSHRMVFILAGTGRSHLAHHIAREFLAKFGRQSRRLPVMALTADSNMLGVVGNDYGEADALARQAETFVSSGDVVIGLALWEKEVDLAQAMGAAVENKARTVLIIGKKGGVLKRMVDVCVSIPTNDAARIEECHLAIGHALYHVVDEVLSPAAKHRASSVLTKFGCRKCGAIMVVSARFAGRKGVCPHCNTVNIVPSHLLRAVDAAGRAPIEKRQHIRFAVRDAMVQIHGDTPKMFKASRVELSNLGVQGCELRVHHDKAGEAPIQAMFPLGHRVILRIQVPAFPKPIVVTGEVVRCLAVEEGIVETVGVRFVFFEEGSAENIAKLESDRVLRNLPSIAKT